MPNTNRRITNQSSGQLDKVNGRTSSMLLRSEKSPHFQHSDRYTVVKPMKSVLTDRVEGIVNTSDAYPQRLAISKPGEINRSTNGPIDLPASLLSISSTRELLSERHRNQQRRSCENMDCANERSPKSKRSCPVPSSWNRQGSTDPDVQNKRPIDSSINVCDSNIVSLESFKCNILTVEEGAVSPASSPPLKAAVERDTKEFLNLIRSAQKDCSSPTRFIPREPYDCQALDRCGSLGIAPPTLNPGGVHTPSSAPSPTSSYTGSPFMRPKFTTKSNPSPPAGSDLYGREDNLHSLPRVNPVAPSDSAVVSGATCMKHGSMFQTLPDGCVMYVPGMELMVDASDITPIDLISGFGKSPVSLEDVIDNSNRSVTLLNIPSFSRLPNQLDSNVALRPDTSAHTSPVSNRSDGPDANIASKARYAQLRQQCKRMEQTERQPLPALHLHLSKDGSSPLPPGWQRAPNLKQTQVPGEGKEQNDEANASDMYAYYYYHVRTRQTRWDPPVYPWDADPTDTLSGETGEDDPEAPYNWGCASKYSVTHEEIEAMYTRIRQRVLERQCMDLLHEFVGRPDAPRGATEQSFAIELFTLVHNVLRTFRDARCRIGRILNDEDLYYLTKKLAQAVILKEVQKLHHAQAASSSSLFSAAPVPEVNPSVTSRVTTYVKKYMESKGSFYRRRVQPAGVPPVSSQHGVHLKPDGHHHRHHHRHHSSRAVFPTRQHPIGNVGLRAAGHEIGAPNNRPHVIVSNRTNNNVGPDHGPQI